MRYEKFVCVTLFSVWLIYSIFQSLLCQIEMQHEYKSFLIILIVVTVCRVRAPGAFILLLLNGFGVIVGGLTFGTISKFSVCCRSESFD